jgi:GT2 family glycosyltransferase
MAGQSATACDQSSGLRVSIVMLTFNRLDVTRPAIASVRATAPGSELIIVDNGSTDGTLAYLDELERAGVRVVRNTTNRGVAAGWNQGLRLATGDHLMVLNNDVLVSGDWLARMVRVAATVSRAGLVGCRTNYVGGPQKLVPEYGDAQGFDAFARRYATRLDRSWFELPRVVAVAMLWRREVYEHLGDFDEQFSPANFEDDDYCVRALAAGYRNLVANDVFIHHVGSASQRVNALEPDELLDANWQRFVSKWGPVAAPVIAARWASFEQHVALLRPDHYYLPAKAMPHLDPRQQARHLAQVGRRLWRLGLHAPARTAFRLSLRTALTWRGLTGAAWSGIRRERPATTRNHE